METEKREKNVHEEHRKRMFVKLFEHPDSFHDHEIVEILLYFVFKREDTNPLAHRLLDKFDTLENLINAKPEHIRDIFGADEATAKFFKILGVFFKRINQQKGKELRAKFDRKLFYEYLYGEYKNMQHEEVFLFFVDKNYRTIKEYRYENNEKFSVKVDLSEIMRLNSVHNADGIVMTHNHISGNPNPSSLDISSTIKFAKMLSFSRLAFYDHIIVAGNKIFSFKLDGPLDAIVDEAGKETQSAEAIKGKLMGDNKKWKE